MSDNLLQLVGSSLNTCHGERCTKHKRRNLEHHGVEQMNREECALPTYSVCEFLCSAM